LARLSVDQELAAQHHWVIVEFGAPVIFANQRDAVSAGLPFLRRE